MDTADARPLALATAVHHHPRRDPRAPRPRLSTRAGDHQHQPTPQPEHPGPLTLPETGCQPQILHVGVPARTLQPWDNTVYPSVTPANPSIPPHQPSRSVDPGLARPTSSPISRSRCSSWTGRWPASARLNLSTLATANSAGFSPAIDARRRLNTSASRSHPHQGRTRTFGATRATRRSATARPPGRARSHD